MDERLVARLLEWLARGPVVMAQVLETRGAVPRRFGSRMLVCVDDSAFSIGGGEAESRVLDAAHGLLSTGESHAEIEIDLSGRPGSAGVCGGGMRIGLDRWSGAQAMARAESLQRELHAGRRVVLPAASGDADDVGNSFVPDARLLIVGGGHCGLALYDMALALDFEIWVHDGRAACFEHGRFAQATALIGDAELLAKAQDTQRSVYAVLLNRDYHADVAALDVLCRRPPFFLGMMGSRRRIAAVRAALPAHAAVLETLHAPVGIEIDAETPEEIAISILAQLIAVRRRAAWDG